VLLAKANTLAEQAGSKAAEVDLRVPVARQKQDATPLTGMHLLLARRMARRDVGPLLVVADNGEDLQPHESRTT
jgi:hypothetical protein